MTDEVKRIQQHYHERDTSVIDSGFWTFRNPVVLHVTQERERVFWRAVRKHGLSLTDADVLDVGAGVGSELLALCRWGASARRVTGVDLVWERVIRGHKAHRLDMVQANGARLPFADGRFTLVMQNVVFSSIVSAPMRREVAAEMMRVLAPGGTLLWYDARRCRGSDPHFMPVPKSEVEALFPQIKFTWYDLTSDIGLLKLVNRVGGEPAMHLVDALGIFHTHLFGIGTKELG